MRKIIKTTSPINFENFKTNFKIKHGRDAKFEDLVASEKRNLKEELIKEQYGLCCYCMKRIDWYNSHVEHFIPRSVDSSKEMDYYNLLASCNGYNDNQENCGHKKDNWYNEYLTISPLSDECETIFKYTPDGRILSDDMRGKETIEKLELDNDLLKRARKTAIYMSGFFDEELDEDTRKELLEEYSTPVNGELEPFCKAITYCLENVMM